MGLAKDLAKYNSEASSYLVRNVGVSQIQGWGVGFSAVPIISITYSILGSMLGSIYGSCHVIPITIASVIAAAIGFLSDCYSLLYLSGVLFSFTTITVILVLTIAKVDGQHLAGL